MFLQRSAAARAMLAVDAVSRRALAAERAELVVLGAGLAGLHASAASSVARSGPPKP
jgi:hypothetical protein